MSIEARVRQLISPVFAGAEAELYDVEHAGGVLRIVVDRPGGVDMGVVADITRQISRILDEADPLPGRYTLEVTTPGLERTLRTPAHFAGALGEQVHVKTVAGVEGDRRVTGLLEAADDEGIAVRVGPTDAAGASSAGGADGGIRRLAYGEIERARTVFEWGPAPKPGRPGPSKQPRKKKASTP